MKTKTQSEITWNFQFEDNEFAVAMLFVYLNSTKTNKAQPTRTWKIIEIHTLIKYEHLKTKNIIQSPIKLMVKVCIQTLHCLVLAYMYSSFKVCQILLSHQEHIGNSILLKVLEMTLSLTFSRALAPFAQKTLLNNACS